MDAHVRFSQRNMSLGVSWHPPSSVIYTSSQPGLIDDVCCLPPVNHENKTPSANMPPNSWRQNSWRRNPRSATNSESRRARSPQGQQPELGYTFVKARGKKQRTYQALQSLATAPESVIELFQKLYEAYSSTIRPSKPSKPSKPAEDANVREYLQDGPENNLDAMLRVTVLITDAEEAAMVKQALRYVLHDFVHKKLLRDALNADECETYQRLARIGALV